MTTSGVLGVKTFTVAQYIDAALRRCGLTVAEATPDIVNSVIFNLESILRALPNQGFSRSLLTHKLVGTVANTARYDLAPGITDTNNVLIRSSSYANGTGGTSSAGGTVANAFDMDLNTACIQTSTNGNISFDFGAGQTPVITYAGICTYGNQTYSLVYEFSTDGINWTAVNTPVSLTYSDRVWAYIEWNTVRAAEFFRVRETNGGILQVRSVYFGYNSQDIPMARFNQQDYQDTPSKWSPSLLPRSYYIETSPDTVFMNVYPVPSTDFNQFYVAYYRQTYDINSLQDTLDIPTRWLDAISWQLSANMSFELDGVPQDKRQDISSRADRAMSMVNGSDQDRSPTRLRLARGYFR